jgi:hypothetical protein
MLHKFFVIAFLVIACSCNKIKDRDSTIWVYKTKNDYSKNVPVELSIDKSKITSIPGLIERWPVMLIEGFSLNGSLGPNTAYLSLIIDEYNKLDIKPSVDTLFKLIIDNDPYIEFYQRNDDNGMFRDENGAYGIDTIFINELIKRNELEKYFVKLK